MPYNPNPPPCVDLNGNDYPKRTDESGVNASGSPGSVTISTYLPIFDDFIFSDGTSVDVHRDPNPFAKTIYINESGKDPKTVASPRGGYATYLEIKKFFGPSWTALNETQRFTSKFYLYNNPISGQTQNLRVIPEISWNIPFTHQNENVTLTSLTIADPDTSGTQLNKVLYPGWYWWDTSGQGEGAVTLNAATPGWTEFDFSRGISQSHYDKFYGSHNAHVEDGNAWLRFRDASSTQDVHAALWQTTKDTTGKYLYIGDTANTNLSRFYDISGTYPPYGVYTQSLYNNFAFWNTPGVGDDIFTVPNDISCKNYTDTAPLLDHISQGTTLLGTPSFSRLWMKIRLPVSINGLIVSSLLQLIVVDAEDSNRILVGTNYTYSDTSWSNASSWATMEAIYDSTGPTDVFRNLIQPYQVAIDSTRTLPCIFHLHGAPRDNGVGVLSDDPDISVPYLTYSALRAGASDASCTIMLREPSVLTQTYEEISNTTTTDFKLGTTGTSITAAPTQKTFIDTTGLFGPRMIYAYLPPKIGISPTVFNVTTAAGVNPSPIVLVTENAGYGVINISYASNAAWITPNFSLGEQLEHLETEGMDYLFSATALTPGVYVATLTASHVDAEPTSVTATVNLTVTNDSFIVRSPTSLSWTILRGGTLPSGTFQVWDGNSTTSDEIEYTIASDQTWCSVSPTSGSSTNSSHKVTHTVSFDSTVALFAPGTYNATLTITDTNGQGSATVTVTLQITEKIKPAPAYGSWMM